MRDAMTQEKNRTTHERTEEAHPGGPLVCVACGASDNDLWAYACGEDRGASQESAELIAWRGRLSALEEVQGTALNDGERREVDDAVAQVKAKIAELTASAS